MPFFTISPRNIIVLGFSNGGLFTSDLYLKYVSQLNKNVNNFSISIFINYMGGI
jgi:predicted esterase